jgi:L-glutamine-phosphate cytidylyltransferase
MKAILLAAGRGSRLAPLTDDRPKCMVEVGGAPLLSWQMEALRASGVDEIVVVRGYCRSHIQGRGLRLIDNEDWNQTNMVQSLYCALDELRGDVLIAYTDLLYQTSVVDAAKACAAPIGVVVDHDWYKLWRQRMEDPLVDAETMRLGAGGEILEVGRPAASLEQIEAQYIGMIRLSAAGCETLRRALIEAKQADDRGEAVFASTRSFGEAYMTDLLMGLIQDDVTVQSIPIRGGWTEVDSIEDLQLADRIAARDEWQNLRSLVLNPAMRVSA